MDSVLFWVVFHLVVLGMIYLDLKVFHRNPDHEQSIRSMTWCCLFWVGLSLSFNALVGYTMGGKAALAFFTAYLLEASLSLDNLFLFLVIFSFCQIESKYQHRVLYLGILGALVFRLSFILLGISLLQHFEWMYFVFGAILCISAFFFYKHEEESPAQLEKTILVKWARKHLRFYEGFHEGQFFLRKEGKLFVTSLFLALFLIETSDLLFAIDSIPAVLAITSDPFIAYTSNVCAILGLRSFYFLLLHIRKRCAHAMKTAIAWMLLFIGIKLLLRPFWEVPGEVTLFLIVLILTSSFFFSRKVSR